MSVTIKDVARYAGVSVATVSRVLNGSASVSETTSKKVDEAIEILGYSPNFLGRNLRKRETNIILAIIPSTKHTFYSGILQGMQSKASELGYDVLMSTSNSDNNTELRLLGMLSNRIVDAAILLGTRLETDVLKELNKKYCISLCCERIPKSDLLTVSVDDEKAAYDAVSYLISQGHRRIAMISTNVKAYSSMDREKGYERAMYQNNIPVRNDYFYKGSYDYTDGAKALRYFMSLDEKPTAVFAVSDLLAAGAAREALKMGLNVGKDFSVMGFDNISVSEIFLPELSTVEQPCIRMGRVAVEKTIENLNGEKCTGKVIMPHKLILRESTGRITV